MTDSDRNPYHVPPGGDHWYVSNRGLITYCHCVIPERHNPASDLDSAISLARQWMPRSTVERRRRWLISLKEQP